MDDQLESIAAKLAAAAPGAALDSVFAFGELTLTVDPSRLLETLQFLRDDPAAGFISIIDISGVDYPEREKRFDVVYHLLAPKLNRRVRIKVATDDHTPVPSATAVYPGADWYEREIYDLFGVLFDGHPDLRRLLTDYGFEGHPLRKDFPMTGSSRCATTTRTSGCATSRCASIRNSASSISSARGKARRCQETRRRRVSRKKQ